jgi:anaerobic ribonucleoside-triphosphate reductase activating protein
LRIAGFDDESVVDGPGIRLVIFAQGCPHHCPGCHNQETWDPDGGWEISEEEIIGCINRGKLLRGVTFSGGEPFAQAAEFASLAARIRAKGLDIVTYSGYTFEELLKGSEADADMRRLLELTDLLVDGPFLMEQRDIGLTFRGSLNQRLIRLPDSLQAGRVIEAEY